MINFKRSNFYPVNHTIKSLEILDIIKDQIIDFKLSDDFMISDISSIQNPKINTIVFVEKKNDINNFDTKKTLVIFDDVDNFNKFLYSNKIIVKDISKTYISIVNKIFVHEDNVDYVDDFKLVANSYISKFSKIDKSTKIYNNCVIGRGVTIGKNCIIKNNVVIKNTIIKDNVIIGDNTSIGTTGFGFNINNLGATNILPQIGIVFIDENVRIGSNCTVDRAKIDYTYIGKNSMIDNLVHIAHNVIISSNACIAAQTGISGSTIIGNNLIVGGQSGFSGHLKIGNNVVVAGKSGVTKNIKDKSIVAGFPATDIKKWKKIIIKQRKNGYK